VEKYGFLQSSEIPYEIESNTLLLHRPINNLNRVCIEATNYCNLGCKTCIRNIWNEHTGFMKMVIYRNILKEIRYYKVIPDLFIGGFGEPLTHPEICAMIREAKSIGTRIELISNGTLLTERQIYTFIKEKLDTLWISIDSVCPGNYEDIRYGASFEKVVHNINILNQLKTNSYSKHPALGISFVAMKRNIQELPDIITFAKRNQAEKLIVTNVLAHNEELAQQRLYEESLHESGYSQLETLIPRMDIIDTDITASLYRFPSLVYDCCPFILQGSISIRWDGKVSPCLPLLHNSMYYLGTTLRKNEAYFVGSLSEKNLSEIWKSQEYTKLRKRLKNFDFSPCTICFHNSCELVKSNYEDCFSNEPPACGGCLWAQGFIRCP
jgi:MoaA/NifB/PqqE/SkfB family radical SAM enzyme